MIKCRARWLVLMAALILGSCRLTVSSSMRFWPPPEYRLYWEEMVRCSGVVPPVDFTQVQFRLVDGRSWWEDETEIVGLSVRETFLWHTTRTIYLASFYKMDPQVVMHEMLHTILNNRRGHPYWPGTWPCKVWSPEGYVLRGDD